MNEKPAAIRFESVGYTVGETVILAGLDLEIVEGETLVLLGESGCGKTTTLKMINRLIEPTAGEIFVQGRSILSWDPIDLRRSIGYVLQEGGLFPHFTIADNVSVVLRLTGMDNAAKQKRAHEMLGLVGLASEKFAHRYPHELSGGQRQRVGVARALAADPKIILLDEPFGALDAITRSNLQKEFAKLVRDLKRTAVFVTHDINEAMLLGTRIALMDKGKIVLLEKPEAFRRSQIPLVRAYLDTVFAPL